MLDPIYTFDARRLKLLEALRSGEYKQCRDRLYADGGYCCLGVACDVYHKETGLGEWSAYDFHGITARSFSTETAHGESYGMPPEVSEWFGFADHGTSKDGSPLAFGDDGHSASSLISLNDDLKMDFNQIADIIEEKAEGLFI